MNLGKPFFGTASHGLRFACPRSSMSIGWYRAARLKPARLFARPALRLPALPFYVTWLAPRNTSKAVLLKEWFPPVPLPRKPLRKYPLFLFVTQNNTKFV
jgi:hypothetical protein